MSEGLGASSGITYYCWPYTLRRIYLLSIGEAEGELDLRGEVPAKGREGEASPIESRRSRGCRKGKAAVRENPWKSCCCGHYCCGIILLQPRLAQAHSGTTATATSSSGYLKDQTNLPKKQKSLSGTFLLFSYKIEGFF